MANELNPKKVVLSQIIEDLYSGMTRWKKDDIGFGSLEKKYSLTMPEMIELLAHPKVKNIETKIPCFIIVDDIADVVIETESKTIENSNPPVKETTIQVAPERKTAIIVKQEPPKQKIEAFI